MKLGSLTEDSAPCSLPGTGADGQCIEGTMSVPKRGQLLSSLEMKGQEINPKDISYPSTLGLSACQVPRAWLRGAESAPPSRDMS